MRPRLAGQVAAAGALGVSAGDAVQWASVSLAGDLTQRACRSLGAQLEVDMNGMTTWIIALIALVVGAVGGYYFMKTQADELAQQVTVLEEQVAEAQSAASETEALQAQLDEATKRIEEQQARIAELEAAAQQPMMPSPQAPTAPNPQ
jgi:uncharacterized protein HemX